MAGYKVRCPGAALFLWWTCGQLAVTQPAQRVSESVLIHELKCFDEALEIVVEREVVAPSEGVPGVAHRSEEGAEAIEAGAREGVPRTQG